MGSDGGLVFDEMVDVVVVGSGGAGFATALGALDEGLSVLMVEGSQQWGGSTASPVGGCGCRTTR